MMKIIILSKRFMIEIKLNYVHIIKKVFTQYSLMYKNWSNHERLILSKVFPNQINITSTTIVICIILKRIFGKRIKGKNPSE
jgi:hypothetical protein